MINDVLQIIQTGLKAPKGQFNSFGKYAYRSCEDILEALKPLLSENKATLTLSDDVVAVGDRIYIKATATLSVGEETRSTLGWAREEDSKKGMDASQVTGAASSYARKYALNGLFAIDDNKDSDATNDGRGSGGKSAAKTEEPREYKCCDCGKPYTAYTSKTGTVYSAAQIYHMRESDNVDKKPRCKECTAKAGTGKAGQ